MFHIACRRLSVWSGYCRCCRRCRRLPLSVRHTFLSRLRDTLSLIHVSVQRVIHSRRSRAAKNTERSAGSLLLFSSASDRTRLRRALPSQSLTHTLLTLLSKGKVGNPAGVSVRVIARTCLSASTSTSSSSAGDQGRKLQAISSSCFQSPRETRGTRERDHRLSLSHLVCTTSHNTRTRHFPAHSHSLSLSPATASHLHVFLCVCVCGSPSPPRP